MDKLLNMRQAADRLGKSVRTLQHWRLNGTGPPSGRIGARVVYRERDIDAWVDAQFDQAAS